MTFKMWIPCLVWTDAVLSLATLALMPKLSIFLPDLTPPTVLRNKYPVAVSSNALMMVLAWSIGWFSIVGIYILYCRTASKCPKLYPPASHFGVVSALATGVTPWAITFGYEKFVASNVLLYFAAACFIIALVSGAKNRAAAKEGPSTNELWWFDRTSLDGMAVLSTWFVNSTVGFGSRSLAYEDGPAEEPQLRGLCDPNSTCATYLLPIYVGYVLAWIYLDLYRCPNYTRPIKAMYPMICYTSISVFIRSHPFSQGIPFNHAIHVVILVLAMFAGIFRQSLQKDFSKDKKES